MHIDSYSFGKIVIDGKSYMSDVIITPSGVCGNWWRREGHLFSVADLKDAFVAKPKCLILGTGSSGMCRVLPEVESYCDEMRIEIIVRPTSEAVKVFNDLKDKSTTVAALHLTC